MRALIFLFATLCATAAFSQDSSGESLAKGLGLYVFPSDGQDQETQDADEYACYKWAMDETGVNPLNPPQVEAEQAQNNTGGATVGGAVKGAAAGAAIGAIAGDTGTGAAIGAVTGTLRGRARGKQAQAQQQQANDAAAANQEKELMNNFKKAFTACMTGKGYTVQ